MHTAEGVEVAVQEDAAATRILLASDDVAARLTLKAILEKSGYQVDGAASAAEAMEKIENSHYALILCGLGCEGEDVCRDVIRFARSQDYRPATAHFTASGLGAEESDSGDLLIETVDTPALLTKIADLIANRVAGRAARRNGASAG